MFRMSGMDKGRVEQCLHQAMLPSLLYLDWNQQTRSGNCSAEERPNDYRYLNTVMEKRQKE
jgi:hypothetical protein